MYADVFGEFRPIRSVLLCTPFHVASTAGGMRTDTRVGLRVAIKGLRVGTWHEVLNQVLQPCWVPERALREGYMGYYGRIRDMVERGDSLTAKAELLRLVDSCAFNAEPREWSWRWHHGGL